MCSGINYLKRYGDLMKKLMLIIFLFVVCASGRASTFCAKSDMVVLGVNYENTKSTGYQSSGFDWRINLDGFGVVSGVASCSNLKPDTTSVALHNCLGGNRPASNWGGTAATNGDVNDNFYGRSDGQNCWCKMMHPFESGWVYLYIYQADCATNCAAECAVYLGKRDLNRILDYYGSRTWQCVLATVGIGD